MNICIPKERRPFEYRVGLSPHGVHTLVRHGHTVYVEHEAGKGAGFCDEDYERAGARIVYSPHEVFGRADLLVKVGRPLLEEIQWLQPGAIIMGLLHLASARHNKITYMLENDITSVALEQIETEDGDRPVLKPMSRIGGLMAVQVAARLLQNNHGGKGILLGGLPGVPPAEVVVIGAGVVGTCATRGFLGLGAHVTVLDINQKALERIFQAFPQVGTLPATPYNIARTLSFADVVVCGVLKPGARAPLLITREMIKSMKPRALLLDISIDQGGCAATSRPTTHDRPTYIDEGVIHYAVPNMPGVVARTATHALVTAAMPYILAIADKGIARAMVENPALARAINTYKGELRNLSLLTPAEEK